MKLKDFDFRVWNNGKYHYPIKINNDIVDINLSMGINDEIELFTGLYDKNGKKIYVGDILKYTRWCEQYMEDAEYSETIYEIVCFDIKLGLYSKLLNGECGWFFEHFINDKNKTVEEMEIIGNIHENKELLK
ncbi:phage protein [Campylobacter jejuni subsp. doylei 269.97]|uniref:Phage protein n=2 Tax=Campylobacter jejuni subsp. doylei TaxID=32021 RepID=A7H3W0_CAMJD|nr:phage protein [Campylobacter jejuni subsp. doylei 269.97]AVL47429.1 hypothetical protein CEP74_06505 [Campylobacter jejuni subsp. doylei]